MSSWAPLGDVDSHIQATREMEDMIADADLPFFPDNLEPPYDWTAMTWRSARPTWRLPLRETWGKVTAWWLGMVCGKRCLGCTRLWCNCRCWEGPTDLLFHAEKRWRRRG